MRAHLPQVVEVAQQDIQSMYKKRDVITPRAFAKYEEQRKLSGLYIVKGEGPVLRVSKNGATDRVYTFNVHTFECSCKVMDAMTCISLSLH